MIYYNSIEEYYRERAQLKDHSLGCLIGGACGDALGYAVEFDSLDTILRNYPGRGIEEYQLDSRGLAQISDDTQMSLFTFEGMQRASKARALSLNEYIPHLTRSYLDWYATQTESPHHIEGSMLADIPELWANRAPGNTCMSALRTIKKNDGREVENNSKGCGGVMRVAPIPVYSCINHCMTPKEAAILAGWAAEITHKNPLSSCASAALSYTLSEILLRDPERKRMNREWFRNLIRLVFYEISEIGYGLEAITKMENLANRALDLAESDISDTAAIRLLGEGWVAEETLAIAIFSVMRYIDDFEKCIVCAVNHDGDSDSTGAVAGNIIGAIVGYDKIPKKFIDNLELAPLITSLVTGFFPEGE